jgi:hypothetical protein
MARHAATAMRLGDTDAIGAGNVIGARPFSSVPSFVNSAFRQFESTDDITAQLYDK